MPQATESVRHQEWLPPEPPGTPAERAAQPPAANEARQAKSSSRAAAPTPSRGTLCVSQSSLQLNPDRVDGVQWIELEPAAADPTASPLLRALALLVQPEEQIPASTATIRAEVAGTAQDQDLADVIAATLISRFNGRSISQLCAMGSITASEFTQSVAYSEIFGQCRQEGEAKGR